MLGRELAEQAEIPANYLSKILLALRNAGLVATARGSGGGYWLLRPPDAIHLIDVVELFEGPVTRPTCVLGSHRPCDENNACAAHESWKKVRAAYAQFLEATTLAEISAHRMHRATAPVDGRSSRRPKLELAAETAHRPGGQQP